MFRIPSASEAEGFHRFANQNSLNRQVVNPNNMNPSSPSGERTAAVEHLNFNEEVGEMKKEQAPAMVGEEDPPKKDPNDQNDSHNKDDKTEQGSAMTAPKAVHFKGIFPDLPERMDSITNTISSSRTGKWEKFRSA